MGEPSLFTNVDGILCRPKAQISQVVHGIQATAEMDFGGSPPGCPLLKVIVACLTGGTLVVVGYVSRCSQLCQIMS